jgi:hypothetical protein
MSYAAKNKTIRSPFPFAFAFGRLPGAGSIRRLDKNSTYSDFREQIARPVVRGPAPDDSVYRNRKTIQFVETRSINAAQRYTMAARLSTSNFAKTRRR